MTVLHCRASEPEIAAHAHWGVQRTKVMLSRIGKSVRQATTTDELTAQLNWVAGTLGAKPLDASHTLQGRIARMVDPAWWMRNFRHQTLQENEKKEHAAGGIRKHAQCYVTDHAGKIRAERAKANRRTLERLEVVSEDGECVNLQDVADSSVSNPKLRRGELMMRCRGFEETAEFMGHVAIFLTITCPSRFHRFSGGKENPKWNGETPKDGQKYLSGIWARIRSAWAKRGFKPYGFRVAEPHHDGCPHWHILLFCERDSVGWFQPIRLLGGRKDSGAGIVGIAGARALEDSPTERGAVKARFTCKLIDPSQGSATGYIAKYICKNIDGVKEDGEAMGLDFASGTAAGAAAKRVRDWASAWRIRQFQQIGGPGVTVWRELRRLAEGDCQQELFEKPRAAADRADWFGFWMLQGGPEVKRTDLTLKPFRIEAENGKYGDMVERIKGVEHIEGYMQTTRTKEWTVQPAGANAANVRQTDWEVERAFKIKNADFLAAYGKFESQRVGEACTPWTGVNNCTAEKFDFSSFEKSGPDPWTINPTGNHLNQIPVCRTADVDTTFYDLVAAHRDQLRDEEAWTKVKR